MPERRSTMRHIACVLAQVERGAEKPRSAIIRDISITGALLYTRAALRVGERVKLSLYLAGQGGPPLVATGEVLRSGSRPRKVSDLWPRSAAVRFDSALVHAESKLAAIASQQAKVFGDEIPS